MRKHLLIAGTGRSGTSLLVRILDACGLETEISRRNGAVAWDENANAGIESIPVVGDDHPYVVKSPWSYQFIRELLARPDIRLDGVLLPVRDLSEAVASRIILELRERYEHNRVFASQVEETWREWGWTAGGVTYSLEPLDQARILAHSLHRIIEALLDREIPIHFLKFPRFAEDIEYLHRRLLPVFPTAPSLAEFSERVGSIIEVSKIRAGRELSSAQDGSAGGERPLPHDAPELPSFETLNQIALKRELRSTVGALERTKAERAELLSRQAELVAQRDAVEAGRAELLTQQTDLVAQRDALVIERADLLTQQTDLVAQRDALATERADLLTQQSDLVARCGALEAERAELLTRQADLAAQRDALQAERTDMLTRQTDLVAQRDALEVERVRLEARLAASTAERAVALDKVDQLVRSTSWKMTQPMRAVVDFVRNRK